MFESIKAKIFGNPEEVNLFVLRNTHQNLAMDGIKIY